MFNLCFTSVSSVFHHCLTNVSTEIHPFFKSLYQCFKNVSKMFKSCLLTLKSLQVPEPMEGLFDPKIFLIKKNFSQKNLSKSFYQNSFLLKKSISLYFRNIESLAHSGVFRHRKSYLFDGFRPLKSGGAFLEY